MAGEQAHEANVNTTITFKAYGEELSYDLSDPKQREEAASLLSKGKMYNREMHDIGENKRLIDAGKQYAEVISGIKDGTIDLESYVAQIEAITGKTMTRAERREAKELFEDDSQGQLVSSLKKELDSLKNQIRINSMAAQIETASSKLERELNGSNGLPKFEFESVRKYAEDNQIYHPDPYKQYMSAYQEMNREKIAEVERKKIEAEVLKKYKKNESAFAERGDVLGMGGKPPVSVKGKSWDQIVKEAAASVDGDSFEE